MFFVITERYERTSVFQYFLINYSNCKKKKMPVKLVPVSNDNYDMLLNMDKK